MIERVIDLIRHGEPEGGSRYRGHGVDDPLSDLGWQQMREAVKQPPAWQAIVSSPLLRCQEFAHWLSAEQGLPLRLEPELREIGFGAWEGRTRAEIQSDSLDEYRAFYANPVGARPAGAEPLQDFQQRVSAALEKLLRANDETHLLLVVHAGVIRAALGWVMGIPIDRLYQADIPYAGVTRLRLSERGAHLVFHNRQAF